jgi:hypothetical protein
MRGHERPIRFIRASIIACHCAPVVPDGDDECVICVFVVEKFVVEFATRTARLQIGNGHALVVPERHRRRHRTSKPWSVSTVVTSRCASSHTARCRATDFLFFVLSTISCVGSSISTM